MVAATRSNSFFSLHNVVISRSEIENYEYYFIFPLLKEISNYWGYTSKNVISEREAQEALTHTYKVAEWSYLFHIYPP